jgi:glycosyltransferase involved in cell wall biosynthesis
MRKPCLRIAVTGTRGFPGVQGGVESHCEKLYTRLSEKGCRITVFTRTPYVAPDRLFFNKVRLIPLSCPKNKFFEAIVHTVKSIFRATKLDIDVLHIHAIGPSLLTPLARMLGMKVVVTNHGPDYERKKWALPARIFLKFCEMVGCLTANQIIAIADHIAKNIKKKWGREAAVIPNGVEIPQRADTEEILKKYGLSKNGYILSVGRFVPEKGFDDLIAAFNLFRDFKNRKTTDSKSSLTQEANMKLVIVGDADHADSYSRNLKKRAENNRDIILTGFLKGKPLGELYTHAGLFVIPSHHEGLPIVLLEAMSYGLSCIASNIPANQNVKLADNRFFEVGNIHSLEEKIRAFIGEPIGKEEREEQMKMIAEHYDWSRIADETLKVYERLI